MRVDIKPKIAVHTYLIPQASTYRFNLKICDKYLVK